MKTTVDKSKYNDRISQNKDLHLDKTYELCVAELTSQQSKRDQIIAFYIAIVGFVVPTILGLQAPNMVKALGYILLYGIGAALSYVVIRYRVYKEVYWVSCRVIQKLYNYDENKINKALIQDLYTETTQINASSIICTDKAKTKIKKWDSFNKKIKHSAETMLFEIMVFIPAATLLIGVSMMVYEMLWTLAAWRMAISVMLGTVAALMSVVWWNYEFARNLTDVYQPIFEENSNEAYNKAFHKAWFLHFYID